MYDKKQHFLILFIYFYLNLIFLAKNIYHFNSIANKHIIPAIQFINGLKTNNRIH